MSLVTKRHSRASPGGWVSVLSVTEPFREKIHINPGVKKLLEEGGSREKWMRESKRGGWRSICPGDKGRWENKAWNQKL